MPSALSPLMAVVVFVLARTALRLVVAADFLCPGAQDKYATTSFYTGSKSGAGGDQRVDPKYPKQRKLEGFTVASAASSHFFDRLENLIGSLHIWESELKVVIYDVGLTASQLQTIACWNQKKIHVSVRPFNFSRYPPHVRELKNYAWKVLAVADAVKHDKIVLWMDSGLEVRQHLDVVRGIISVDGYVSALQHDNVEKLTHPGMLKRLGLNMNEFRGKHFCAGSLQGFIRGGKAEKDILEPAFKCAMDASCIAPKGANRKNHHFDQSIFTMLAYHKGYKCQPMQVFCNPFMW
jgi:hypothetical protein